MREFEDRFIINNIPYRVIGGPRFYERQEIRDVIAYLQLVINPDNDLKFERIINTPRRGIGETTLRLLIETSRTLGLSLYQVSKKLVQTDEIKQIQEFSYQKLITMIDGWIEKNGNMDHVNLTQLY